jgi:hypothetical protein
VFECQTICNRHASQISRILEASFVHGWKALVDPLCNIIMFESMKHQIVYLAACSTPGMERRRLWDNVAFNLSVNMKALNSVRGFSKAADECVCFSLYTIFEPER